MNNHQKETLKALINYILEGGRTTGLRIKFASLFQCHVNDLETISVALHEWEQKGYLKILKDPSECKPEDDCIEMISFIEQKSPIKGWLNWE